LAEGGGTVDLLLVVLVESLFVVVVFVEPSA